MGTSVVQSDKHVIGQVQTNRSDNFSSIKLIDEGSVRKNLIGLGGSMGYCEGVSGTMVAFL